MPAEVVPDVHRERLAACCRSIHTLLLELPSDIAIIDTLDYLLGAAYGLLEANKAGFQDRPQAHPEEYAAYVVQYADIIAHGKKPQNIWLAGYHFNSGIQRLAAVFDRFSLLLGQSSYVKATPRMTAVRGAEKNWDKWHSVYREVNAFKHRPDGRGRGRTVTFADAVEGIEQAIQAFTAKKAALGQRYSRGKSSPAHRK